MATLFVLDVPEFSAIVRHCQTDASFQVSVPKLGYWRIVRAGEITLYRKELGFKHAVWYGVATGGLLGHITQFDQQALVISDTPAGAIHED